MAGIEASRQINIKVHPVMHKGLEAMAQKAGMAVSTYAGHLLGAAYTARVKPPTGDQDLDAAVGLIVVLWGNETDTATIAKIVGLKEATVVKVLATWRAEMKKREGNPNAHS